VAAKKARSMTQQLDFDLSAVRTRRDDGVARSIEHATAVEPTWRHAAVQWVRRFITVRGAQPFLTEDVRAFAAEHGFESPTDGRAWGQVMRDAAQLGLIVKDGYRPARSSNLSPKPLWRPQ
jgi:hypothetical protein